MNPRRGGTSSQAIDEASPSGRPPAEERNRVAGLRVRLAESGSLTEPRHLSRRLRGLRHRRPLPAGPIGDDRDHGLGAGRARRTADHWDRAAVAIGAFVGDNASYWLGRKIGDPVAKRLFTGNKGKGRLRWAEQALRRRGVILIAIGRFIPGGRTATTFAAGTLEMPYRNFLVADGVAACVWALYISMLGYLGGATFKDNLWLPLGASLACAMLVALGFEAWRRWQRRRGKDILGDRLRAGADT